MNERLKQRTEQVSIAHAEGPSVSTEFINELGNRIKITIEGPTSTSENILTPLEVENLRRCLSGTNLSAGPSPAVYQVWRFDPDDNSYGPIYKGVTVDEADAEPFETTSLDTARRELHALASVHTHCMYHVVVMPRNTPASSAQASPAAPSSAEPVIADTAKPVGFAIVPLQMTAAMINAWSGGNTVSSDAVAYRTHFQEAWQRVLDASPAIDAASDNAQASDCTDAAAFQHWFITESNWRMRGAMYDHAEAAARDGWDAALRFIVDSQAVAHAAGANGIVAGLIGGLENCIENAKLRGDQYDVGYMTAMLIDAKKLLAKETGTPDNSQAVAAIRALYIENPHDELGPSDESQYRDGYNTALEDAADAIAALSAPVSMSADPECTCSSNPHLESCPVTAHIRNLFAQSGECAQGFATPSAENRPAQDDVRDAQRWRYLCALGNNKEACDAEIDAAIASQSAKEPQ